MALANVTASLCLLSLSVVFIGAGLLRLDRLDRRRTEYYRQAACRWHHWQVSEEETWLVCDLCGKRSRKVTRSCDRDLDLVPSDSLFP